MMRRAKAGYSLVEVLIAVAVTGFVLLTVVTLFFMGRRNVYSGKQTSYAVSVATRMLEDVNALTAPELESNFGIDDQSGTPGVTIDFPTPNTTYVKSLGRDTDNISATTDPGGYLAKWKALIPTDNLANAQAGMILTPMDVQSVNLPWTTGQLIKVRVYVAWDESKRRRYAYFDTTKSNR